MADKTMKEEAYDRAKATGKPVEIVHGITCGPEKERGVCDECLKKLAEFWALFE